MSKKILLLCILFLLNIRVFAADVVIHKNETSGLLTWSADDTGFRIELIQLLPDFIRAIYAKHDFPGDEIERIASFCVFGTILKNTSRKQLSYQVANWRYRVKDKNGRYGEAFPVKTKSQWLAEWEEAGILFSWTLLPDTGEFAEGDWQQGFTTIALPRESVFDLIFRWELDGVAYTGVLPDLKCAPEKLPAAD